MIERMAENDKIVTRYMADQEFQGSAFPILAREIFEAVRSEAGSVGSPGDKDRTEPAKRLDARFSRSTRISVW